MKRIVTFSFCLLCFMALFAGEVEFRAKAPGKVVAGEAFQLTYSVNQQANDLQPADFNGFEYLAGPYSSQSSSTTFVNGQRTSTYQLTYTYMLRGRTPGDYTIGPASIVCNGKKYTSNGVRITVLPPDQAPSKSGSGSSSQSGQSAQPSPRSSQGSIFVRTIVTKTNVFEQEALQVSYRLYVAGVDFAQMGNTFKLPEFTGFLKQDIDLSASRQFELEHYDGRNYQAVTLFSYLLFPQHAGDIKIDAAQFESILRERVSNPYPSVFDDFFYPTETVSRMLTAPAVTIHVKPLPSGKPAGYSGGVGHFTFTPSISTTDVNMNEAITLTIDIKGAGNMKLIKTPLVDWPEGFETFDPQVTNNFKTTSDGFSGTKHIEYLAIPRAAGQYTIPEMTFSYFDTQSGQYKVFIQPEYTLNIRRVAGASAPETGAQNYSAVNKEDIRHLGSDIRYIVTDESQLSKHTGSTRLALVPKAILCIQLVLLLVAALFFFVIRHFRAKHADVSGLRYRHASRVAQKRLKAARKLLNADSSAFFAEIEKAAVSYLSDRLRIPMVELAKDNIADLLRQKNVSDDLIHQVVDVLSRAEFARYAPASDAERKVLYDDTTRIINRLENQKL